MARFGRRLLRGIFSRAYKRVLRTDPAVLEQWQLVVITARIAEGIEAEFPALHRLARKLINDKSAVRP